MLIAAASLPDQVTPPLHCPPVNLMHSGTEPKLKYYLEVSGQDPILSNALADRIERAVADDIVRAKENGLRLPGR